MAFKPHNLGLQVMCQLFVQRDVPFGQIDDHLVGGIVTGPSTATLAIYITRYGLVFFF